jgi:two-component system sensor histidine kinase/response regulator
MAARKLRQILLNLLGNAIKFTGKGRITLRANFKDQKGKAPESGPASRVHLEFEVEDTGIGIAPENMERIFEPFVQLDPAQRPSGGIGLGLSICRKYAALLDGEISVRSQVGRGTAFQLNMDVQPAERSDIPAQLVPRQVMGLAPGQRDFRLLIVDDHSESRVLLRQLLEPVGFKVLEAASGPEAIDLYQKDRPHLVWMDIRIPGMDGYEAARRIREAERERRKGDGQEIHTPIIALTAGVMENKESSPLAGVFDDWVYKPFRETEIFEKLEKHLGVRFVYQPSVSSAGRPDRTRDQAALTPADLSGLPGRLAPRVLSNHEEGTIHPASQPDRPDSPGACRSGPGSGWYGSQPPIWRTFLPDPGSA